MSEQNLQTAIEVRDTIQRALRMTEPLSPKYSYEWEPPEGRLKEALKDAERYANTIIGKLTT